MAEDLNASSIKQNISELQTKITTATKLIDQLEKCDDSIKSTLKTIDEAKESLLASTKSFDVSTSNYKEAFAKYSNLLQDSVNTIDKYLKNIAHEFTNIETNLSIKFDNKLNEVISSFNDLSSHTDSKLNEYTKLLTTSSDVIKEHILATKQLVSQLESNLITSIANQVDDRLFKFKEEMKMFIEEKSTIQQKQFRLLLVVLVFLAIVGIAIPLLLHFL
jgi:chromosome segregation ATPase